MFGTQLSLIAHSLMAATILLSVGIVLWSLTYTIFTAFIIKREKPPLEHGIYGAWLIAVVATQSIAILAALIARDWPQPHRLELNFFALSMWLWGGMFYIWIISLIFYRSSFFAVSPSDLTPLLDQHRSDGDLRSGRRAAGIERARRTVPGVASALSERFHGLLLDHVNVVDSDVARARRMAAHDPAFSAPL